MIPWGDISIAGLAVTALMLAAHWSPVFHGSHNLWRYVWGLGWVLAGTVAVWAINHAVCSALGVVIAMLATAGGACAGTLIAYAIDRTLRAEGRAGAYAKRER